MIEVKGTMDRVKIESSACELSLRFTAKFGFTHKACDSGMFPEGIPNDRLNRIREDIWQCLLGNKQKYVDNMKADIEHGEKMLHDAIQNDLNEQHKVTEEEYNEVGTNRDDVFYKGLNDHMHGLGMKCFTCYEREIADLKKGIELIDLITTNYTDVHHTEMMEIGKIVNDRLKEDDRDKIFDGELTEKEAHKIIDDVGNECLVCGGTGQVHTGAAYLINTKPPTKGCPECKGTGKKI